MDAKRLLIFKVCVAALWANEKMARQERDYANNLIERLSETEADKTSLRTIQTHDINLKSLESEIQVLPIGEKHHIFEECFGVNTSDKVLDGLDLRFLKKLKSICGISNKDYRRKIKEARVYRGVKIRRRIKKFLIIVIVAATILPFAANKLLKIFFRCPLSETLTELHIEAQLVSDDTRREKLSAAGVYNVASRSVVTVLVKQNNRPTSQGTGSIIAKGEKDYYILTNKHVVQPRKGIFRYFTSYEIQLYTGARFDAKLDCYSRKLDLALLRVRLPDEYVSIISISPKKYQSVGDRVFSLGTPIGLKNTFTEGIISALRDEYIQTDATIFYGNSGGPLINERAELIGVVTKSYIKQNYSFAIYADSVKGFLVERKFLKFSARASSSPKVQ